jgi:hypothetical protein
VYVITDVPADTPLTTPVIEFIVATAPVADVQTPPAVVLVSVVVDPIHALAVPPIAASVGKAFTLTVACAVEIHPFVVTVYVIVAVPAATPVTTPVEASTVATALDDDQTPPAVALVNVVAEPAHTSVVPLIAATTGRALTVTACVTKLVQPFAFVMVYVIVAVPAETPLTTPVEASTVAVAVLDDVQTPPAGVLASVVVAPAHTLVVPVIAVTTGKVLIVTD